MKPLLLSCALLALVGCEARAQSVVATHGPTQTGAILSGGGEWASPGAMLMCPSGQNCEDVGIIEAPFNADPTYLRGLCDGIRHGQWETDKREAYIGRLDHPRGWPRSLDGEMRRQDLTITLTAAFSDEKHVILCQAGKPPVVGPYEH